ncbi:C-type lectin domain family 4 member F-like isoform X5 [Strix uralensis]|uniref:C-type lectin domain family 4 member F-like isoform X5 n=1 Tax=Strix uralensis TaxID=36305 RepID=UPI003DA74369
MLSQFSRRRRHLRPLQQRPAACWAPHWPWPRGCCWCWGPPWSPSSSCMCRGRQSCGQRRQSWRQLGPRCCWILMVPRAPPRAQQQRRGRRSSSIYYFSGEHKAWGDAEAACRSSHSHLASITSPEEQDYLAREARGRPYWIGLTATGPGGSWRWVDGAAYSQAQSFWAPGQPDSTDHGKWGLEGCAQIHPVGNGLWNDHNCNFTFAWICKRDLSRP